MKEPKDLFDERHRTMLVLAPQLTRDLLLHFKLRWQCQVVNYRELLLGECVSGRSSLSTDAAREANRVRALADQQRRGMLCLWELEYILAYFDLNQRTSFMRVLREGLPHMSSVVLLPVRQGSILLSGEEIQKWLDMERVIAWEAAEQ